MALTDIMLEQLAVARGIVQGGQVVVPVWRIATPEGEFLILTRFDHDKPNQAERALDRAEAIVHAELKRGVSGLATIGSTAPFVGLFGTVIGIMHTLAPRSVSTRDLWISTSAGGIAEALVTTSLGLLVAVPAVWAFNYFSTKLELYDLEMNNSVDAISTYLSGFQAMKRN